MTEPHDPTRPRFLTASELRAALPVTAAVDALERALTGEQPQALQAAPRSVVPIPTGRTGDHDELLLMPAVGPEGAGAKVVTLARGNPALGLPMIQGVYILFSPGTLAPELMIDAAALTGLRTAAVSALASRHLAREDSHHLVVFGAGAQAQAHVEAMRSVLPIERLTVIGHTPTSARARALVVQTVAGGGVEACTGGPQDVRRADVICTCTTSTAPLFDGDLVAPGTHINAIGAYRPGMCELDAALLARALLVVETRDSALAEAGDILRAIESGLLAERDFAHELTDVVHGRVGRLDAEQITVFKSVGLAVEDLILARAAAARLTGGR